jgi:hypothetical protein
MKKFTILFAFTLLAGCARDTTTTRTLPGGHVLRESKQSGSHEIIEMSVWKQTDTTELLVCRIMSDRGKVVSIMPTPVQTDTNRPTANFITMGDGWTRVLTLRLDERGKLFQDELDMADPRSIEFGFDRIDQLLQHAVSLGPVYLTVEQNADVTRFEEVFSKLAASAPIVGVGWKHGWW